MIENATDRVWKGISEMFGNHFVSLVVRYGPKGSTTAEKDRIRNYSGFIMSIRGMWFLVTAGHILQEIDDAYERGDVDIKQCELMDSFGNAAKTEIPTPFVFESAPKMYVHDDNEGLDFGLVGLRSYYQQLLEANGIIPFTEATWLHQPQEFKEYILMGLPFEWNPPEYSPTSIMTGLAFVPLQKLTERPSGFPETKHPRFYARLLPEVTIKDIEGVSGGPIFGIGKDNEGRYRYWVVAIQSGWLRSTRTIAACPLPVVGKIFDEYLQGLEHRVGDDEFRR